MKKYILCLIGLLVVCFSVCEVSLGADNCPSGISISLEQIDDNAPLGPKNRMCSNAQAKYKNVEYRVNFSPSTSTVKLVISGTAGVTFSDGTTSKNSVASGTTVTLAVADNTKGTWELKASLQDVETGEYFCNAKVAENVFKFYLGKTLTGGSLTIPPAETGGYNSSGSADKQVEQIQDVSYDIKMHTNPANMCTENVTFTGDMKLSGVSTERLGCHLEIWRNTLSGDIQVNGWAVPIPGTPLSLSVPSSSDSASAAAKSGMRITSMTAGGSDHNASSTGYTLTTFTTLSYYEESDRGWSDTLGDDGLECTKNITRTFDLSDATKKFTIYAGRALGAGASNNCRTRKAQSSSLEARIFLGAGYTYSIVETP